MDKEFDFVAIGDTVTDAFIRLKEASVHCTIDKERCEICMKFADKIPYESVTVVPGVGNSANASVSAARLGLKSALMTDLGDDYFGKECIQTFEKEKVSTDFVKTHAGMKTNYHYVLWYEDDRTILIKHEEYPYDMQDIGTPKWVYLSSLGEHSLPFHDTLIKYFKKHPEIKVVFQPGSFQIRMGKEKMKGIYETSEIVFCNKQESQRILQTDESDIKKLMEGMHALGPKIAVVTDDVKGAYAYDGSKYYFMRAYPDPKPPLDRTGAGDSFSSTVVIALALGMDLPTALQWGPINSMSVVQYIGAQEGLLTRDKLEEYLKKAPEDYKPQEI